VRHSSVRFSSRDHYVVGPNGDDSGSLRYSATLPVAGLMFAWSPQLHVYGAMGPWAAASKRLPSMNSRIGRTAPRA
jgi:hypothetical protein